MSKPSMSRQVGIMFSSLILVLGLLLLTRVLAVMKDLNVERLTSELSKIVGTAALQLDGESYYDFKDGNACHLEAWQRQRNFLERVRVANNLEYDHLYSFRVDPTQPDTLYFAVMLHDTPFVGHSYKVPESNMPLVKKVIAEGGTQTTDVYEDANGTWISAFTPIYGDHGEVTGILQADFRVDAAQSVYVSSLWALIIPILVSFLVVLIPAFFLVKLLTRRAMAPLSRLAHFAEEVAQGNYEASPPKAKWQELTQLSSALDHMRTKIKSQMDSLKTFNRELETKVEEKTRDLRATNEALIKAKKDLEEQAEAVIEFQKTHDPMTLLGNRKWFGEKLVVATNQAQENDEKVGVLILGLDRFNRVNETAGTTEGDKVLKKISARLQTSIRSSDQIARVDGDGFGVILNHVESTDEITSIAQTLLERIAEPIQLDELEVRLSASLGISLYPNDCTFAENLMRDASTAMKVVKRNGGDGFRFYTQDMDEQARQRLALERDLRDALAQEQLQLYYQPQINVATGELVGVESLVRWIHPEKGVISPGSFIPLAEETGLIVPMGKWILERAFKDRKAWTEMGLPPFLTAINLSGRQFEQEDLVPFIGELVEKIGVDPRMIELEITESIAMNDVHATIEKLAQIKAMGMALAIDDFGTGYSSLSYLKQFSLDKLKVDRSFIINVLSDGEDVAIVDAIIQLGHSLGLTVIAEGVEEKAQLEFLLEHGCDEYQGYYFSKPVPYDDLVALVHEHSTAR